MNIFDDLIEELKDENLLEATVIKTVGAKDNSAVEKGEAKEDESATNDSDANAVTEAAVDSAAAQRNAETEFYRRRAKDEVAFLQMVEYVFAGVEREQLKTVPKPYNDVQVRKFLHSFLQISDDPQSPAHHAAQFRLLQETESWHSSLSLRDANILTAHLRRFCETARPSLGSPALISLARFYRNSTYSESVRSKFDLVVTRLFSKEIAGHQRETLFTGEELNNRLTALYAEWSSVPLYPTEANNAGTMEIVERFAAFVEEADDATRFDELIENNFFNRLYQFKESVHENFFAPPVVAAAVESNVRIGNRYVALLEIEKAKGSAADFGTKYGFLHDQAVSEATGKTLALGELLNHTAAAPSIEQKAVVQKVESPTSRTKAESSKRTPPAKTERTPPAAAEPAPQFDKRLILLALGVVLFVAIIYLVIG